VGYAGGSKTSPTYDEIGDHVECVEVLFDPSVISYEELLDVFWESHDPYLRPYANQYSSLILAADKSQLAAARGSVARVERADGRRVPTRVETLVRFYPAEDYHQKYYLRQDRALAREFHSMFGDDQEAMRDSSAAARVNGYIAGYGSAEQLQAEIDRLGLTEEGALELTTAVDESSGGSGCAIN